MDEGPAAAICRTRQLPVAVWCAVATRERPRRRQTNDICYEVKCYNPLAKTHANRTGVGTPRDGGSPASVGAEYSFGNTEEHLRLKILGCAEFGRAGDPPFSHKTAKGYVRAREGEYADALKKKKKVVPMIFEPSGAMAPETHAHLRKLDKIGRDNPAARDGTRYGKRHRRDSRRFITHHIQRISFGIAMEDAKQITGALFCVARVLASLDPGS